MKRAIALLSCMLGSGPPVSADPAVHIVVQHSTLAGFRHHEGRILWHDMKVGDRLTLLRDAGNPYDPHAIRVEWGGRLVGYVPRRENGHLARQLDRGAPLMGRITRLDKSRNGRNRVSYEVFVPLDRAAIKE